MEKKPEAEKIKTAYVYLTVKEKKSIEKKFGDITKAVREIVLPKCA